MHGHEKSDSAVVAMKPANKAERSAAEPVERRAGTEGKASQHSTRRAQDRESVSQALARIRQTARERKKERFTALFHHLSIAMLRTAFFALKRDAAPGIDTLTLAGLRSGPRSTDRGPARTAAPRSLPGAGVTSPTYTKAGRPAAPARDCRPRGQDRPAGGDRSAERDLRGRLPRVLVRVPTAAQPA